MRAAICREHGQPLAIEEVTLDPPGPGQIAVRLAACAICHSDLAYVAGAWGGTLPAVYGHEAAGHVSATGPGISGYAPGDPVLVTLVTSCGACPACTGGAPTSCAHAWDARPSPLRDSAGAPVTQAMNTGAFAEAVVVDASQCVPLPDDLPLDQAALLACGVITGVGAVFNTAKMRPGAKVAVIGAGGIGLNVIQGAALAGAARIVAIDLSEAKLADARLFGASDGLIAGPDAPDRLRAILGGAGADYVFVAIGSPQAMEQGLEMLGAGGSLVLVGMTALDQRVAFDPCTLVAMNQRILGARMGETVLARDIPWLIDRWREGRLKLAELITARYPLDAINAAMEATRSGSARRNVIVFDPESVA
jgi:Zn-dependent alcohol dehydrogenase